MPLIPESEWKPKPPRTFPADDYHPHYPDQTKDYFLKLMNAAEKFSNRNRLAYAIYDVEPPRWELPR